MQTQKDDSRPPPRAARTAPSRAPQHAAFGSAEVCTARLVNTAAERAAAERAAETIAARRGRAAAPPAADVEAPLTTARAAASGRAVFAKADDAALAARGASSSFVVVPRFAARVAAPQTDGMLLD